MPEPDFEQLAIVLLSTAGRDGPGSIETAELLRQVWNARGAADLAAVASVIAPENVDAQIRSLDR